MDMYQIRLTIGDWSDDGHGRTKDFIMNSNMPVEAVREAHFKIRKATGIDIENICSEYEEDEIDKETVEILKDMGFKFSNTTGMGDGITNPEEMAKLWVFLLQKADPSLELELQNDNIPNLHFYGFDEKGRHISCVGYGLFS